MIKDRVPLRSRLIIGGSDGVEDLPASPLRALEEEQGSENMQKQTLHTGDIPLDVAQQSTCIMNYRADIKEGRVCVIVDVILCDLTSWSDKKMQKYVFLKYCLSCFGTSTETGSGAAMEADLTQWPNRVITAQSRVAHMPPQKKDVFHRLFKYLNFPAQTLKSPFLHSLYECPLYISMICAQRAPFLLPSNLDSCRWRQ